MKKEYKCKFLVFKYKDGTTISQQWDELYDGPWKYGDKDEVIFYKDYNWIYADDGI
jgi:hypothetical protein